MNISFLRGVLPLTVVAVAVGLVVGGAPGTDAAGWDAARAPRFQPLAPLAAGTADIKLVSQTVTFPASFNVGEPVNLIVNKVIHNNGPDGPVDVTITKSVTLPADCSLGDLGPGGTQILTDTIAAVAVSIPTTYEETDTIVCTLPSDHQITLSNCTAPEIGVTDPNMANNCATAVLNFQVDDGDLVPHAVELACGSDRENPAATPERANGVDDDGDLAVDEGLPVTAPPQDCDGDGYSGAVEAGTPLCGNGMNDDFVVNGGSDDTIVDDGCPGGPPQAGAFSEAQFKIGTNDQVTCGTSGWASDFVSGGIPDSTNRINILDITTGFLAPVYRMNTSPGHPGFSSRSDLIPGRGLFSNWIGINDLTTLLAGSAGNPRMFHGDRAFGGATCRDQMHNILAPSLGQGPLRSRSIYGIVPGVVSSSVDESDGSGLVKVAFPTLEMRQQVWGEGATNNSRTVVDGPMGWGWEFSSNRRLLVQPSGNVMRMDGSGRGDWYLLQANGSFRAPAGSFTTLVRNSSGTYSERFPDGTLVEYGGMRAGLARVGFIRDRNGNQVSYTYNINDLVSLVRDDLGRSTSYVYNAQGRLSTITDYTGRVTTLAYDSLGNLETVTQPAVTGTSTGNNFSAGKATRFTYSSGMSDPRLNHNLLTITAPNEVAVAGPPRVQLAYGFGTLDLDRVISATIGGTNASGVPAGGTETFAYSIVNPSPPEPVNSAHRRVTVMDANGNQKESDFSRKGFAVAARAFSNRDIRMGDPAGWTDTYTYNLDGQWLSVTPHEGNSRTFTYDSGNSNRLAQGNLLSRQVNPDPDRGGDQVNIKYTYTYEPIFQRVRSSTDPRGADTSYVPQNGGAQSAARYTLRYRYDYEEGCDFTAIGVKTGQTALAVQSALVAVGMCLTPTGDLNADGNTLQVSGEVVVDDEPPPRLEVGSSQVALEAEVACSDSSDSDDDGKVNDGCPAMGPPEVECDDSNDNDSDTVVNDGCLAAQRIKTLLVYNSFGQVTSVKDAEANVHTYEYYPENDPDGDGTINCSTCNTVTGGYLKQVNIDTASDPIRNSGTNPTPVNIRNRYLYNPRGAITRVVDGRGIATDYERNQLDQVVVETRAAAVNVFPPDPMEPLPPSADAFLTRYWYDANDNVVLVQREDRGNTRQVDGNLPSGDLPAVAPNPDATGGTAYQDVVLKHDMLDRLLEHLQEVGTGGGVQPESPRTQYRYDRNGNLALMRSPRSNLGSAHPDLQLANVESMVYDERDMVATSTRGGTTALWQALAAHDDIPGGSSIPNSAGVSTRSLAYDGNRSLVVWTDAQDTDGIGGPETTRNLYDGFDRLQSTVDPAGGQSFYRYDPGSAHVSVLQFGPVGGATPTDASAATTAQPLNPSFFTQKQLSRTDARRDELFRRYAVYGHLYACDGSNPACSGVTHVRTPVIIDGPLGGTNDGLVVARTDHDRLSRPVVGWSDHSAAPTQFAGHNGFGVISYRDADNNEWNNVFRDDNGNIQRYDLVERSSAGVVPPITETFTYRSTYDSHNRKVRDIDPLGHTRSMAYDSSNYLVAWSDAQNNTLVSDPLGQYPGMINNPGNTGSYIYDGLGRQIVTRADLRMGGTGAGAIDTTNPSNPDGLVITESFFEPNSKPFASVDDGSTTGDNNSSIGILEPVNPLGNVTRTVYDDLNRPTQVQYDDGTMRSYVYDRDDNVTQVTDQNGSVFTHSYDALNRVKQVAVTPGSGVANRSTLRTYQYDALNRLVRATDNNDPLPATEDSTVEMAYDSLGNMLEERQQIGTGAPAVVSSRYDGTGRRVALIYPDGRRIDYQYDALNRLIRLQDAAEPTPTATYSYLGERLLERTYQNGVRLTMRNPTTFVADGYDGARRPVRIRHLGPPPVNAVIADFQHILDRMGNRTEELRLHSNAADTYTYDSIYRVSRFTRDASITPPGLPTSMVDYMLDGNGNWDNFATDNNMNEYSVFQGNSRTYDNNGNLLMTGTMPTEFNYQYDSWNRLVGASTGGGGVPVSAATYDAMGRRNTKTVSNSGPFNDSFFYSYDGSALLTEDAALAGQKDYLRACPLRSDGTASHDVPCGGMVSVARMDVTPPSQPTRPPLFFHEDGKGNIAALTDPGQTPVERLDYDPYGVPTFKDGAGVPTGLQASDRGNPFLFGGMHQEPEGGPGFFKSVGGLKYESEVVDYKADEGRYLSRTPRVYKGSITTRNIQVVTPRSSSSCGVTFQVGCGGSSVYTYAGGNPAGGAESVPFLTGGASTTGGWHQLAGLPTPVDITGCLPPFGKVTYWYGPKSKYGEFCCPPGTDWAASRANAQRFGYENCVPAGSAFALGISATGAGQATGGGVNPGWADTYDSALDCQWLDLCGQVAAVSVPNYTKFQMRSKQSEAKSNMKAMFTAEKAFYQEKDRYSTLAGEVGFAPERNNRYAYFLNSPERTRTGLESFSLRFTLFMDDGTPVRAIMARDPWTLYCPRHAQAATDPTDPWSISTQSRRRGCDNGGNVAAGEPANDLNDVNR